MIRPTFIAAWVLTAASWLIAAPAGAQTMCGELPNALIVNGSADFEPVLRELAVKLAAESPPTTIVVVASGAQSTSCGGVASVVNATDLGGLPGRYFTPSGTTIVANPCMFSAGQTAHVAVSEVFYESCSAAPQPRPVDVVDVAGPAQAMVFLVPKPNTLVQYITYDEARAIYGCGVSSTRKVANFFLDPSAVYCLVSESGTQLTMARNLGIVESQASPLKCARKPNDARMVRDFIIMPTPPCDPNQSRCGPPEQAIGFANTAALGSDLTEVRQIAFQAPGQTRAYYSDSAPAVTDRRNVRDGHYPLWGYIHFVSRTSGGNLSARASDLAGWMNGTKTSAGIDAFELALNAGLIPQCAMKVKRSADGGLLSPFTPSKACHCAFEARSAKTIPTGCVPCASASGCPSGLTCQHGFCD